jgi:uncharacterized protein involved in exopolysaccharide biosynthesis
MANSSQRPSAFQHYLAVVRRRYVYVGTILPGVVFIAILAAFGLRPQFQATATIMLEPSSVPKDIIESTVLSYSDQQIEIVQGRVMTIDSLSRIVQAIDPYPDRRDMGVAEKAQKLLEDTSLEKVDPVSMKPQAESNAFSLHYDNPDRDLAVRIDERLAQLFLTYNQAMRTAAAGEAAGFLQKQSEQIVKQMRGVDAEIAALKSRYGDALPELLQRNQSTVEDTQHQLDNLQQQILLAQEKESVLSVQLGQTSPNLITSSGDLTDLATVRAKLTEAEQRYTPDHPEVKRLRRALETLMKQQGGAGALGVASEANNPQYQLIAAQLKAAHNELANLQAQAGALRAKLDNYRALVQRTPGSEKEINEVLRRKEALQNEYQRTQDKLQSANLAETFESQQGGERFTLLRAPVRPRSPVFPNRVGLILLGMVLGLALTVIAIAIAESSDRKVRTARDAAIFDNYPVLASIPRIRNSLDQRRRALIFTSFATAYSVAAAVAGAVILLALHRR